MKRIILTAMGLLGMAGILSAQDSGGPMTGARLLLEGKASATPSPLKGKAS